MPYRCSIPNCKGNYSKQNRVRVFSFPNDPELKKAWEKVIPRKDFGYTKNSKICEKHFNNDDIRWESSAFDERSNKTITVTLERPRLKPGAIPSVFPEFSSYLAKEIPAIRESPNKKRLRLEQQHFAQAIAFSVMIQEQAEKSNNFKDFDELLQCLNMHTFSPCWDIITKARSILFLNFKHINGILNLIHTVLIDIKCNLSVLYKEKAMTSLSKIDTFSMKVNKVYQISQILDAIESLETIQCCVENLVNIIKSLLCIKKRETYEC